MDVGIQHHIYIHIVHPSSYIRIWPYNVVSGTADNQIKRREERKGKGKERKRKKGKRKEWVRSDRI